MKILHTSDWHLGKRLLNNELLSSQISFLEWLKKYLLEEKIDVLLVAGDVFDTAYPPLSALEYYNNFLAALYKQEFPRQVIITDGNHDSRSTLKVPKDLLKALGTNVICEVYEDKSEHIFTLYDTDGRPSALVAAVPFLRDQDLRRANYMASEESRTKSIQDGITQFYHAIADEVEKQNTDKLPVIAMGHLYARGASIEDTDAERPIQMGHQAAVTSDAFERAFDYVALGHIHKAQKLSSETDIRYAGSPYPLSFSERNYTHKMWLLDIEDHQIQSVTPVETPQYRKLIRFKGTFDEIKKDIRENLPPPNAFPNLIELVVQEPKYDSLLRSKIDDWRNEFHDAQDATTMNLIAKYAIEFTQKKELDGLQNDISETDFTADKVFLKRLDEEEGLDDALREKLIEAFTTLSEKIKDQE